MWQPFGPCVFPLVDGGLSACVEFFSYYSSFDGRMHRKQVFLSNSRLCNSKAVSTLFITNSMLYKLMFSFFLHWSNSSDDGYERRCYSIGEKRGMRLSSVYQSIISIAYQYTFNPIIRIVCIWFQLFLLLKKYFSFHVFVQMNYFRSHNLMFLMSLDNNITCN